MFAIRWLCSSGTDTSIYSDIGSLKEMVFILKYLIIVSMQNVYYSGITLLLENCILVVITIP